MFSISAIVGRLMPGGWAARACGDTMPLPLLLVGVETGDFSGLRAHVRAHHSCVIVDNGRLSLTCGARHS